MKNSQKIVLGGGCFWCLETLYMRLPGVLSVKSGYMGGALANPTYQQVCSGDTGHAEVVKVEFDPQKITLEQILDVFWKIHDPTTLNRQGNDVGTQYRSVIFYNTEEERATAEQSKDTAASAYSSPIVTEISKADEFYPAEDYHDDYFNRNPSVPYCQFVIAPKVKKFESTLQ